MGRKRPVPRSSSRNRQWLSQICQEVREELAYFDPQLMRRGSSYIMGVREFRWNSKLGELSCQVKGSAERPYTVALDLTADGLEQFSCSCPYGEEYGSCKHSYAVLSQVYRRLAASHDELQDLLLSNQEPAASGLARVISDLDRFLVERQKESAAPPQEPQTRLVWRVEFHDQGRGQAGLGVFPYEQKLTKTKQNWSKGRKLTWDRLLREEDLPLGEHEQKLIQAIQRSRGNSLYGWYGYGYATDPQPVEVLSHLVGHPLVFWEDEPDEPLEVRAGQFGVVLEGEKKG